jgi:hypothetical protein
MDEIDINFAKYYKVNNTIVCINAIIDGINMSVPLDPQNRHYAEIMRQVDAGTLTIAEAE